MNPLLLLDSLKDYVPKWVLSLILLAGVSFGGIYYLDDGVVVKIKTFFGFDDRVFNLSLPQKDLEYILLDTGSDQVGVWSHSYYVPESKSLTSEMRKDSSEFPNIIRTSIPVYDTPNQSLHHWSLRCYGGVPEMEDLRNSGVSYIISCPITKGANPDRQTLSGFLQVEFKEKPENERKVLSKVSKFTKIFTFQ
ncbi:hypothetical protein M2G70_07490 [Vibrio vulnificus]|nr:hypothetical protein [Vibrio vulnificus]